MHDVYESPINAIHFNVETKVKVADPEGVLPCLRWLQYPGYIKTLTFGGVGGSPWIPMQHPRYKPILDPLLKGSTGLFMSDGHE